MSDLIKIYYSDISGEAVASCLCGGKNYRRFIKKKGQRWMLYKSRLGVQTFFSLYTGNRELLLKTTTQQ